MNTSKQIITTILLSPFLVAELIVGVILFVINFTWIMVFKNGWKRSKTFTEKFTSYILKILNP